MLKGVYRPDPTWLQWRRRLDPMQPFCRIAGHTSEEIREILATLETVFQPLLPQLDLRQWTSSIYAWLTHTVLDPARSGRVSMDNLMKLVLAALEWSYEAKATDVQVEYLELAAELLVLRHDTFRVIDGAGPSVDDQGASSKRSAQANLIDEGKASQAPAPKPEQDTSHKQVESQKQPATQPKCTFHGEVPIDLQHFSESGVDLVECPNCTSTSALSPHKGILHFKPHKRRKTRSTSTEPRWVRREMICAVVKG